VHPASGIPYDVIGEAMGAQEQLQVRRSARVRDLRGGVRVTSTE
jgi:hypothetical protein